MKKVLAFVLAAIMVCCVAFAADPADWVKTDGTKDATTGAAMGSVIPTKKIVLKLLAQTTDATLSDDVKTGVKVCQKDGKLDLTAGKNEVKVTFAKGADLVASQGWDTDGNGYSWVIKTKENLNHVFKDVEIEISKIEFKAYGINTSYVTIFDGSDEASENLTFTYGYLGDPAKAGKPIEINIGKDMVDVAYVDLRTDTVYKTVKTADGDSTYKLTLDGPDGGSNVALVVNTTGSTVKAKMISGNVFTVKGYTLDEKAQANLDKNVTNNKAAVLVEYNGLALNTSATIEVTKAKDTYKAYAVDGDGNVTLLASKVENGVMTFDVKTVGAFVVVDGTLTATGAAAATSTNPNTGANDVIGVAAALAVVALVSGAAISLKK